MMPRSWSVLSLICSRRTRTQCILHRIVSLTVLSLVICTLHSPAGRAAAPQIVIQDGHHGPIRQVAVSPDGKWLATVGGNEVKVWNRNGSILWTAPARGFPEAVAWQPDGKSVVIGVGGMEGVAFNTPGDTAGVEVRDARDGTLQKTLLKGDNTITSISYLPSGTMEVRSQDWGVAWYRNNQPFAYPVYTQGTNEAIPNGHRISGGPALLSPDGKYVAVETGGVQIWDIAAQKKLASLWLSHGLGRAAWSPDGKRIATFQGRVLRVWNVATDEVERQVTLPIDTRQIPVTHTTDFPPLSATTTGNIYDDENGAERCALAWSPDGKSIATTFVWWPEEHFEKNNIDKWGTFVRGNPHTQVHCITWPSGVVRTLIPPRAGEVDDLKFLPDGQLVLAGGMLSYRDELAGLLRVMDLGDSMTARTWTAIGYAEGINDLSLSPDSTTLATAGNDAVVRLWDWQHGFLKSTMHRSTPHGEIFAVAWSPDGKTLAECDVDQLALWNVAQEKVVRLFKGPDVDGYDFNGVAWSPDGKSVAEGTREGIKVWNLLTGFSCEPPAPAPDYLFPIGPLRWTKEGIWASNPFEYIKALVQFDPGTLHPLKQLTGGSQASESNHSGPICDYDFYAGGDCLVAVGGDENKSNDMTAKLWNVQKDIIEATLPNLSPSVRRVRVSPDEKTVAVGDAEGVVTLVDLTSLQSRWKYDPQFKVNSLRWSGDGKILLAASGDGKISLIGADGVLRATLLKLPQRPLLTPAKVIMSYPGVDWIAWTPAGQYTGSPGAEKFIRWRDEAGLHPANAFALHRVLALHVE